MPAVFSTLSRHAAGRRVLTVLAILLAVSATALPFVPEPARAATPQPVWLQIGPARQSVPLGSRFTLHVNLRTQDGRPMYGRTVYFDVQRGDGSWQYVSAVRTNSYGKAALQRTVQRSGRFRARHLGDSRWASSHSTGLADVIATATLGTRALGEAKRHYGKAYQWGATGPERFDCSGFTMYVFGRFGKSLPHSSSAQYGAVRKVDRSRMQVGDLVFTHDGSGRIYHVGIYAGDGYMWAATKSGDIVRQQTVFSRNYYVGRVA